MGKARIDQINVVLADVVGAARFLRDLGIEMPDMAAEWAAWAGHHREVPTSSAMHGLTAMEPSFGIDLDSQAFARHWGGLDSTFTGVVLNIRVDERAEVDRLHDQATTIGGRSLHAPYDAFWGSRFAVLEGPGPLTVGIMSLRDSAHRDASPDPATFA